MKVAVAILAIGLLTAQAHAATTKLDGPAVDRLLTTASCRMIDDFAATLLDTQNARHTATQKLYVEVIDGLAGPAADEVGTSKEIMLAALEKVYQTTAANLRAVQRMAIQAGDGAKYKLVSAMREQQEDCTSLLVRTAEQ